MSRFEKIQAWVPENSPITSWLLVGVLVLVVGGLGWSSKQFRQASAWATHTNAVKADIEALTSVMKEAESAERGYLITHEIALDRQAWLAQQNALKQAHELPGTILQNPAQAQRARRLEGYIVARVKSLQHVTELYNQQGLEAARLQILSNTKAQVSERVMLLAQEMLANENALLETRQKKAQWWGSVVEVLAFLGVIVSIVLLWATHLFYRRQGRGRERDMRATQKLNDELAMNLEKLDREHSATRALARFAGLLQGCQTIDEIVQVSGHSFPEILPQTQGVIYLVRASGDFAQRLGGWGNDPAGVAMIEPGQCWGLRQGRPFRAEQDGLRCNHLVAGEDDHFPASTCMPLVVQGMEIGMISIQHTAQWDHLAMAEAAGEQLALALSNMRLRETLRTQSLRDPLTGASNRREFEEAMPREIARALRNHHPLSVLALDIDHFKQFNDAHGHDGGDAALVQFAQVLKATARQEDMVIRMGGEEFLIVLPDTDKAQAVEMGERIRGLVEQISVRYGRSNLGQITCSIGVAECGTDGTDRVSLLAKADEALYRAKANGRNRVETAN